MSLRPFGYEAELASYKSGKKMPCPFCGGQVDAGWVDVLQEGERIRIRSEALRAALEAVTQAELEPDSEDLFYAPGERGLRAIERLLEETKRDE